MTHWFFKINTHLKLSSQNTFHGPLIPYTSYIDALKHILTWPLKKHQYGSSKHSLAHRNVLHIRQFEKVKYMRHYCKDFVIAYLLLFWFHTSVRKAKDFFKNLLTRCCWLSIFQWIFEAEFKEFEPRLKYGTLYIKSYSLLQELSQRSIETGFWRI